MKRETGHYQKLGNLDFFVPNSLPPKDPPFELTPELHDIIWASNATACKTQ